MADSRIRLQPRQFDAIERAVYVGWDQGRHTYYAFVIDGPAGDERGILELGSEVGEVTDPARVIAAVRPYAETPDNLGELLNISRVSRMSTYTDLRDEPSSADGLRHQSLSRNYLPDRSVTGLTRNDITPILIEQRWNLVDTRPLAQGQSETYRHGAHELVVNWRPSDSAAHGERLASPIRVDGHTFGIESAFTVRGLLSGSTREPDRAEDDADEMSAALSLDDTDRLAQRRQADDELDEAWASFDDDPPNENHAFHTGLGT